MSTFDENVWCGGPEPTNIAEGTKSFGELCLKRLKEQEDAIKLVDGVTSEEVTARELASKSILVAESLIDLGIQAGDAIGVCSENRIEFVYLLFGTLFIGATFAPMNCTYSEREINYALNLSKPKVIFASPNTIDKVMGATKQSSFVDTVIVFGAEEMDKAGIVDFTTFSNKNVCNSADNFKCAEQDVMNNLSLILLSSGTTGLPKGVMLTQHNVMIGIYQHHYSQQSSILEAELVPHQINLGILPWFHSFGCFALLSLMIQHKTTFVFLPRFKETTFLQCIEQHKANYLFLVPPLMVFLAKSPLISEYDMSSIKVIWSAAAPLSKEVEDAVKQRIGVPIIRQGYGMTEGSLSFCGQTDANHKSGSVGVLRTGIWGRVIDLNSGKNLKAFEKGELLFKASSIMKGYIGDAEATKNTIDDDGWLHSGDIGYYDNDGEIFVVDRLKELIKYKAFQVPPAEIEGLLLQHPGIRDAGVIGILDDVAGELPFAFVVKQENADVTQKDIIDFIAEQTSPAKRLHGGVRFISEIPKNLSGKILRRQLRDMYDNVA